MENLSLQLNKLKEYTGYDSWFKYYKFLAANENWNSNTEIIEISVAVPISQHRSPDKNEVIHKWKFSVNDLKAAAFDEVFAMLPEYYKIKEVYASGKIFEIGKLLHTLPFK